MFERVRRGVFAGLLLVAMPALRADPLESLADPMQPPVAPAAPHTADDSEGPQAVWRLQGIRIDHRRRSALINGRSVVVGDDVDGAKVLQIEDDRVVIQRGEAPSTLRLLEHDVKRTSRIRR